MGIWLSELILSNAAGVKTQIYIQIYKDLFYIQITLVDTIFLPGSKTSLCKLILGRWFQRCQPFIPSTSGFVCTNFVKYTYFYDKWPNFIRFWWTLLSIIVIFYVEKQYNSDLSTFSIHHKSQVGGASFSNPLPLMVPVPGRTTPPPTHTHTHTGGMLHLLLFSAFLSLFLDTY